MENLKSQIKQIEDLNKSLIEAKSKLDEIILNKIKESNSLNSPFSFEFKGKTIIKLKVIDKVLKGVYLKKNGEEAKTMVIIPFNKNFKIVK